MQNITFHLRQAFVAIILSLVSLFCSIRAQAQPNVDISLRGNCGDTLEVILRPDGSFNGIVSNVVLTIRWDATSGASIDTVTQEFPEIAYIPMAKSGGEHTSGGYKYQIFSGFGFFPMSTFGVSWAANQEIVLMKVVIANPSGLFEVVDDAWTGNLANNGDYFVSLSGLNRTGIKYDSTAGFCGRVTNLWSSGATTSRVRLFWQPLPCSNGYQIRGKRLGAPYWAFLDIPHGQPTNKFVFNLNNNTTYVWQISPYCDSARTVLAPWSPLDTFETRCYEPDSHWTVNVNPSYATLRWKKIVGAAGYGLKGRRVGASAWVTLNVPGGSTTTRTVYGLTPSTTYEWQIKTWCDNQGNDSSPYTSLDTFSTPPNGLKLPVLARPLGAKAAPSPHFDIYPNPNAGTFHLTADHFPTGQWMFQVKDILGQTVTTRTIEIVEELNEKMELKTLPAGLYWVEMANDQTQVAKPFILR